MGSSLRNRPHLTCQPQLILFLPDLLAIALARQCFLHTLLLTWFQVKGVALYLFDNVFRLHLTLEPAQRIFKRLAFLNSNFCQGKYTSKPARVALPIIPLIAPQLQR